MKKSIKVVIKILMFILVILYIPQDVQATGEDIKRSTMEDIINIGDEWISNGKDQAEKENTIVKKQIKDATNYMYNILLAIGTAASVIVGVILGIKYMISSVEEQAKVKETLTVYVIGCIVTFSAFGIWKAVIMVMKNL